MVWLHLVLLAAIRLALSGVARAGGLVALSDDDYARAVIAQSFAVSPRWDPSGTSWLPFPFWITGGAMRIAGSSLEVAWWAGAVLAVLSVWLLYAGGRVLGLSAGVSSVAAVVASALPPAAALGSVAVPELPTAALCAFALLVVARRDRRASLGALHAGTEDAGTAEETRKFDRFLHLAAAFAIFAATLSRYEAWPIAAVVVVAFARLAFTGRSRGGPPARDALAWLPVVVALAGPAFWLAHNRVAHGDALHFLARVSRYQAALGAQHEGSATSVVGYVGQLIGGCPIALLLVLAAVASIRPTVPERRKLLTSWLRAERWPLLGAAVLLGFLLFGAALGGAPTHHPERGFLLVWLLAPIAAADLMERAGFAGALSRPFTRAKWLGRLDGAPGIPAAGALGAAIVALYALVPSTLGEVGVDRRDEIGAGLAVARLAAPCATNEARVLVAADDYGYFAIQAGLACPRAVVIERTHDPRNAPEPDALADPPSLRRRLDETNASWLVAPTARAATVAAAAGLSKVGESGKFTIWRRP